MDARRIVDATLKKLAAAEQITQGQLNAITAILSHFVAAQNGAAIPAAASVAQAAPAFTFKGTAALIIAGMSVQTQAADQGADFALLKDGSPLVQSVSDVSTGKNVTNTLAWIDTGNVVGAAHTYSIQAANTTGGQTVAVTGAGLAWVLVLELA